MARTTTDHEEIRRWAESGGGRPAAVRRTHGTKGFGLRILFSTVPHGEHDTYTDIPWEEFFREFELARLALTYEPDSDEGRLVPRDGAP